MKYCVFTICAKNYLAQALTLRASVLKHNPDIDFYLYLADKRCDLQIDGLVELDDSWIPDWRNMAFKYNVIEFNTSIKPFCFNHLFNQGYEKVIYLDPDIYVTDSLDLIFDGLNDKSVMLTPHYCDIIEHFYGAVSESTFNCVGICNLGFCALKNDGIGNEIVTWWMNRLQFQCYDDRSQGLFVDQKWMDYIPSFFPKQTLVSDHHGLNVAIWNLHERELLIDKNGKYIIRRKKTGEIFPLIFYHFSGFDPFDNTTINRRHPLFNVTSYPTFKPIIEEYRNSIYEHDYDIYSKMIYDFNMFENGRIITPLIRRMYRCYLDAGYVDNNPFSEVSRFYNSMNDSKLLLPQETRNKGFASYDKNDKNRGKRFEERIIKPLLKLMLRIIGPTKYAMMIRYAELVGNMEYHHFLLRKK